MNYSEISVHELVLAIAKEGMLALQRGITGDDGVSLVELESALRSAVIKEASVGTVQIESIDSAHSFVDNLCITIAPSVKRGIWTDYDLIPKGVK